MAKKPPEPIFVLRGSRSPISNLCYFDESSTESIKILSSGSQNGAISIWNLETKVKTHEWVSTPSSIVWMKHASEKLWTCSRSEAVSVWDLGKGIEKCLQTFPIGDYIGFSQCDLISSNGNDLLAIPGPSQESFSVWDGKSGERICSIEPPKDSQSYGSVMQLKWISKEGHRISQILVLYENGELCLWDWPNRTIICKSGIKETPLCVSYNESLQQLVCGSTTETIFSFNLKENEIEVKENTSIINPGINCISGRPDDKLFATGGWDHRIRIFSWKNKKPLAVLDYHKKSIECIQFSKGPVESMTNGFLLAAGSSDHTISLWDIYN